MDAIDNVNSAQDDRMDAIDNVNAAQDDRMDAIDNVNAAQDDRMDAIDNVNSAQDDRMDAIDNVNAAQDDRMDAIDNVNSAQDDRMDAIDNVNAAQDDRMDAIDNVNVAQDNRMDQIDVVNDRQDKNIGTLNYGSNNHVNDGDDLTTSVGNLDRAVGNLDNRVDALDSRVDQLDGRIDKVGASAAALAALHPLDFDPDDKWNFSAGYGNYGGENAMAVGAFYRPNEDTMFSVGTAFGTGENMVNAGISFKIGQGGNISTSRVAMAKEIKSLQGTVAQLTALVNSLVGTQQQVQNEFAKEFPDVPENHWAYETVNKMAQQGIIEGYPDGTFGGDRTMTRYELATLVYRALQKGVAMNEDVQRLLKEFKPELDLIRVDTIAKDKDGNPTIERVRVNKV